MLSDALRQAREQWRVAAGEAEELQKENALLRAKAEKFRKLYGDAQHELRQERGQQGQQQEEKLDLTQQKPPQGAGGPSVRPVKDQSAVVAAEPAASTIA